MTNKWYSQMFNIFYAYSNKKFDRFMTISAILQLNRGFNLIIRRAKVNFKRSKDRKRYNITYICIKKAITYPMHIEKVITKSMYKHIR